MSDANLGRLLNDRYQLAELIGKGAMGRVYRAQDVLLGDVPVAVKFLARTLLNQKMRDRFKSEARTCALLGQKTMHIVRVMDYGVDDDEVPFYVMEYLQGESLSDVIRTRSLVLPRFLSISRQICLGLQCAHHDGVIHRDIKPGNILVSHDTSIGELVKILDFGIARLLQADNGQTNSFMGTLAYSSPEQMEGKELDSRSDIYSLGIMMYEMLTGRLPLQAETHTFGSWYKAHHFQLPRSFDAITPSLKLPKALENLVMSCLAKSPNDRPQSAAEVLKALEPLEERFGPGRQMGHRIEAVLSKFQGVTDSKRQDSVSPDEFCKLTSWPKSKPLAEIVFAQPLKTSDEDLATLWVMMPKQEIQRRLLATRYNQFLFMLAPHPMLLWLTALHNREHGPRWLPCYLDLKTPQGQQMTRLLAENGLYRLLFFALEEPQRCVTVMSSKIADLQRDRLREWADISRTFVSTAQPNNTKTLLKQELEKVKPKILMKLEER
ncbi:serine/threonine protein kinase [Trichocoleus sp. FACHB-591]|uniref:serine/threonine-protein kinase n=1 Tax=Trichocoleus sp. FACHB-591 TaxID=2692872 RepID=UPI001684C48E|nr:serine/threonine-protein kinase [Trichocoleus sp. FACHB-591]MBD2096981.1 serine/threonine protein kinase [Trichocoleus sp. FACHB-591]